VVLNRGEDRRRHKRSLADLRHLQPAAVDP
jgi:hypothetical protein